jgi:hypothetical protein
MTNPGPETNYTLSLEYEGCGGNDLGQNQFINTKLSHNFKARASMPVGRSATKESLITWLAAAWVTLRCFNSRPVVSRRLPLYFGFTSKARGALGFIIWWVLLVSFVASVAAVPRCHVCKDNVLPEHDSTACPLRDTVTANASAMAAVGTALVVVSDLLPTRVVRALPRTALDALKALVHMPKGAFDFTGKTIRDVFDAAIHGHVAVEEALVWLHDKLLRASKAEDINKVSKTIDAVKAISATRFAHARSMQGAHLYIWALTDKCIKEGEVALLPSAAEGDSTSASALSAKLVRPLSFAAFMRRLNLWVMIAHATGVDNVLIMTAYLDDVVFVELGKGKDWKVVHELHLIYLRVVDEFEDLNLGNVYASGGQDTKMREAEANASQHFRGTRGEPASGGEAQGKPWNCACNMAADRFCMSFNLKRAHPATSIGSDGKCVYKHACDKFVLDADGKKVKCGSTAHGRADCDNPRRVDA